MKYGVPNLLKLLRRLKIRATFFVTVGPDYSGLAIYQGLKINGLFLKKMLRTNALRMYGIKTALSGTILPAPLIWKECLSILKDIQKDGHEIGIHSWNHRLWQDALTSLQDEEIEMDYKLAVAKFTEIFGGPPSSTAAPAWLITPTALDIEEKYSFSFASDCRGLEPFYPVVGQRVFNVLQIPPTLPTLDEVLGQRGLDTTTYNSYIIKEMAKQPLPVYVIHSEAEGRRFFSLCEKLLKWVQEMGIRIGGLAAIKSSITQAPSKEIKIGFVEGRASPVAIAGTQSNRAKSFDI